MPLRLRMQAAGRYAPVLLVVAFCTPRLHDEVHASPAAHDEQATVDAGLDMRGAEGGHAAQVEPAPARVALPPLIPQDVGWSGGGTAEMQGTTPADAGAWVATHGSPEPDQACRAEGRLGRACKCEASATLQDSATDLLVCTREGQARNADRGVWFRRVYAARGRKLVSVLDVPFATESPAEDTPTAMAQNVRLDMSIEGDTVTFTDKGDCPRILASVDAALAQNRRLFGEVRKA